MTETTPNNLPFKKTHPLTRLGIPGPLAQAEADHVGWHQIAWLVQRGCPPALAVRIAR